jgi:hypothetical protein
MYPFFPFSLAAALNHRDLSMAQVLGFLLAAKLR